MKLKMMIVGEDIINLSMMLFTSLLRVIRYGDVATSEAWNENEFAFNRGPITILCQFYQK